MAARSIFRTCSTFVHSILFAATQVPAVSVGLGGASSLVTTVDSTVRSTGESAIEVCTCRESTPSNTEEVVFHAGAESGPAVIGENESHSPVTRNNTVEALQ